MANERFSSLRYPFHKKVGQSLDVAFPGLFKNAEFKRLKQRASWEKIVKYILVLYDHNTDLLHEYPVLRERKEVAAAEAGYAKNSKGNWPDEIENIMGIRDLPSYEAIMCFLKIQNHPVWTHIVATEQELEEFQGYRVMSIEMGKKKNGEDDTATIDIYEAAKKKNMLMDACTARNTLLKSLYEQFYGDHKDELKSVEFDEMISPENAERILAKMAEAVPVEETPTPQMSDVL
jgi:hypothetical protein